MKLENLCTIVNTFEAINSNINLLNLIDSPSPSPEKLMALFFIIKDIVAGELMLVYWTVVKIPESSLNRNQQRRFAKVQEG